jgi:hypothetical protein
MELVEAALNASSNRRAQLPVQATGAPRPTFESLETLLKQNIDLAGFDGLAVLYVMDLRSGETMHFAYLNGEEIPVEPDVSFTGGSIIKIGVMVMRQSGNDPADWLMDRIDRAAGPLRVTDTLREMGLESSFLIAYYRLGSAALIPIPRTPGNSRIDIDTDADQLDQVTASEMGMLLADIYQCANGGGTLLALYGGEVTPQECQEMLSLMSLNKIGVLIEGGVPDGTRVAHKHGWTDSPLHSLGDSGIIFSPAGDYVLSLFLWNDQEMIWDPVSRMAAGLSQAVYNYFNPPTE